jgi:hypothetical protein
VVTIPFAILFFHYVIILNAVTAASHRLFTDSHASRKVFSTKAEQEVPKNHFVNGATRTVMLADLTSTRSTANASMITHKNDAEGTTKEEQTERRMTFW